MATLVHLPIPLPSRSFQRGKSSKSKSQSSFKSGKSKKRELKFTPLDSRYCAPQATYVIVLEALSMAVSIGKPHAYMMSTHRVRSSRFLISSGISM
jgi:hypothetical protein